MDAPPPQLRNPHPFDLLELLSSLPDVFINNLLPALEARQAAALALTCSTLRNAVQQHSGQQLSFSPAQCCLVRGHQLGSRFPNVRHLLLRPGNLHEAMNVVPLVLMAARQMTGLTSIVLQDMLADRPNEEAQCGSCAAFTSTYDLSAILATAAHCAPRLRALEFTTHYISDAECAALALMTGLTRLRLRSTHGTHVGGLAYLSGLTALASLSLSDWTHSSRASHQDLCMLLGSSCLTSLSLGSNSLTAPMLNCLAGMHSPDWQAGLARQPAAQPRQADVAGVRATLAQRSIAGTAAELLDADMEQQLPAPPPLVCLRVLLNSSPQPNERAFRSACCLTGLTCLQLGWVPLGVGAVAYGPSWPVSTQQQLSSLTSLQELACGWYVLPEVLSALGHCSKLTSLQLGGLFSMIPDAPPVGQLRLPSVRRLTAQLEKPDSVPGRTELRSYADALAVFPGLTSLELAGRMFGDTLTHMLELVPRQLQVLLLPQRMHVASFELEQLKQLQGLTHLRLGWRSVYHAGPAWYTPVGLQYLQEGLLAPSLKALTNDAGWTLRRGAAAARGPLTQGTGSGPGHAQLPAGSTDTTAESSTGRQPAAAAAAPPPVECEMCGASPSTGCFCRLSHLEVVGPLPVRELNHLRGLPSLRRLTLRDNASWSSGLPLHDLAAVTSQLTLLELCRCQGVDGMLLERPGAHASTAAAAAAAGAAAAVDPSSCYEGCRVVVEPRAGATAAELGRGHQHMGVLLEQWEEAGCLPDERAGGAVYTSEVLLPEPLPLVQLPPEPQQQQQQQQQQPPAHPPPWLGVHARPPGVPGPPALPPFMPPPPFAMPPGMRPPPAAFPQPGLPPPAMLQQMQQMLQQQVQQAQHLQQAAAQLHQQVHQHVVGAGRGGGGGGPRPQLVNLPGGGVFMWQGGPGAAAVHHVPGGVVVQVGGLAQGVGGAGQQQHQQVDVIDLLDDDGDDEGGGGVVEAVEVQDSDDSDASDEL